jgi:hypothetical protein
MSVLSRFGRSIRGLDTGLQRWSDRIAAVAGSVDVGDNSAMQSSQHKHRVVILLGTNYSGSHLLSHLVSAHSQCFGVGELHRYEQLVGTSNQAPVVSQYNASPLFHNLSEQPVEQWYATLAQRFSADQGVVAPVIVDNSKKVKWVKRVTGGPQLDLRLVHLIRDPRALVLRWLNTYDSEKRRRTQRLRVAKRVPTRAAQILTGSWVDVFIYKWLRENRQISDYMKQSKVAHAVVTYRDVVFDTQATLQKLMPRLGLEFEPKQLRFGEGNTFGTTKTAHADAVKQSEIRPDLKWQTQLDTSAQRVIAANKDVVRYLAALNLRLGDDGLIANT